MRLQQVAVSYWWQLFFSKLHFVLRDSLVILNRHLL